jgi:hypothetical protein
MLAVGVKVLKSGMACSYSTFDAKVKENKSTCNIEILYSCNLCLLAHSGVVPNSPRSTKENLKLSIHYFLAKQPTLRSKIKDCLVPL